MIRYSLFASPDYLSRMGLLETLADLENHEFSQDGFGTTSNLELTDAEGTTTRLMPKLMPLMVRFW